MATNTYHLIFHRWVEFLVVLLVKPLSYTKVSRQLAMSTSQVSHIAVALEREGLVRFEFRGREKLMFLTPHGELVGLKARELLGLMRQ